MQRAIPRPKMWDFLTEHHTSCRDQHMNRARYYKLVGDTKRMQAQVQKARRQNRDAMGYRTLLKWWE